MPIAETLGMRIIAGVAALCLLSSVVLAQTAVQVKDTAEKAVKTDVAAQQAMEAWLEEERRLLDEIDKLEYRLKRSRWQQKMNVTYRENLEKKVADLNRRAAEMETINQELLWVLAQYLKQLDEIVPSDIPCNIEERKKRMAQARQMLNDYDADLPEKTRAVFDALAGEVDMGHNVGVRETEISVDGRLRRVKILRVGRVAILALTVDTRNAYQWNRSRKQWTSIDGYQRIIEESIEMAEGTRIIGLSRLPVGLPEKDAVSGGDHVD